jgi:dTDP-4-amino-4,6-dideoxygalactose transaminase
MMIDRRPSVQEELPRLPVLGWAAFAGVRSTSAPSVLDARYRRHTKSGQAAITFAVRLLGLKGGDGVLVPTYHCRSMIAPVIAEGLSARFYPLNGKGEPDMAWLGTADLEGVRAILVPHFFGRPQPMVRLRKFCDGKGIALIEDCAHSFFGTVDGRPVGQWGDAAIASLTKFFPVPEGGLIVSQSRPLEALKGKARGWSAELRAVVDAVELGVKHNRFRGLNTILRVVFAAKKRLRRPRSVVVTARSDAVSAMELSPAAAAVWIADRVHTGRIVALRRRNYAVLAKLLCQLRNARPLFQDLAPGVVPYVLPLYVDDPSASYQALRNAGVPIFRWDDVWPDTPRIAGDFGHLWATHVFQLPCHQDLTPDELERIGRRVRDVIDFETARTMPGIVRMEAGQ